MKISFHYNLHVNFNSFLWCVSTVRKYHGDSPIHLVTDETNPLWKKYRQFAELFDIPFTLRKNPCFYVDRSNDIDTNYPLMKEWFDRMYLTCKMFPETDWVIRLEDDVHLRKAVSIFPETDCAGNYTGGSMGGGSIFKREKYITMYDNLSSDYIMNIMREDKRYLFAADALLQNLFERNGYTYSKWQEISEDWFSEDKNGAVHHGDKSLYDRDYLNFRNL